MRKAEEDITLLAHISREFLKLHKVHRYRMKKIKDMDDEEVISCCHRFYEENRLHDEWFSYRCKYDKDF